MEQNLVEGDYWYLTVISSNEKYLVKIITSNDLFTIVEDTKDGVPSFVSTEKSLAFIHVKFIKQWKPNWFWKKMGY